MTETAFKSAVDLAAMIRRREIGAEELLDLYFARADMHNQALNAIIWQDRDKARETARAADSRTASSGDLPPLHGVPMTIKESYDLAGSPTTWGDPEFRNNIAATDSVPVARLKAAGVTFFGKTNVPLMLADWQSYNDIYGVTNNPWDLERTPGGSSGGSGAALAAGMTGIDAGSDIGSSIRNPAHYCGVFGHKPSWGLCPPRGHALPGVLSQADISVVGPLARSADDLEIALDAMAGPDEMDAPGYRLALPGPRVPGFGGLRVAVMLDSEPSKIDTVYGDLLQLLVDKIAAAGAVVSDTARPEIDMTTLHENYILLLRAATSARQPDAVLREHEEAVQRLDPDDPSYYARMARGNTMRHREWLALREQREHFRWAWHRFFRDWDVLLCPVAASTAFPHDHEGERYERTIQVNNRDTPTTDQLFWAGLNGVCHLPGTVAPAGIARDGLPGGIQIVGPYLGDRTCIHTARLIERHFGGFQAPPGY
ncbi:MAG: amidase [Alphaproteobacteria bacterium]|nr:amidase [Alphaproteobacteria bacterium]MCY4318207.1 amidase [Alphaproteobacteria bacterium]